MVDVIAFWREPDPMDVHGALLAEKHLAAGSLSGLHAS